MVTGIVKGKSGTHFHELVAASLQAELMCVGQFASYSSICVCKYKPKCVQNKDCTILLDKEIKKSHEGTYVSEPSLWEERHAVGL